MISPCSAKRRASDKDLPVLEIVNLKCYLSSSLNAFNLPFLNTKL
jgi:hypothetical protein